MGQIVGNLCDIGYGIIVHGCNAQGVMGSGVAKELRARYPKIYEDYSSYRADHGLRPGLVIVSHINVGLIVANAITQEFYGRTGRKYASYDAIQACFESVARLAKREEMPVYYPMIGCGLGGCQWPVVEQIINHELRGLAHYLVVQN